MKINLISSRDISDADLPPGVLDRANKYDIKFTYLQGLSDKEKFEIISKTKVFVFPTYFEGLGYPPLECLYVNTPVVTYELPVLFETMGELLGKGIYMVPVGEQKQLRDKVVEVYNKNETIQSHKLISKNTKFEMRVDDLRLKLERWKRSLI